jgi:hypothetical protein
VQNAMAYRVCRAAAATIRYDHRSELPSFLCAAFPPRSFDAPASSRRASDARLLCGKTLSVLPPSTRLEDLSTLASPHVSSEMSSKHVNVSCLRTLSLRFGLAKVLCRLARTSWMSILPAIQLTLSRLSEILLFARLTSTCLRSTTALAMLFLAGHRLVPGPATTFASFPLSLFHSLLGKSRHQSSDIAHNGNRVFLVSATRWSRRNIRSSDESSGPALA